MERLIQVYLVLLCTFFIDGGVGQELLTPGHRQKIVDAHNAMRRRESATNMRLMEWNAALAVKALDLTGNCIWTRTPKDQLKGIIRGFDQLSHSVHVAGVQPDIDTVVQMWAEESYNYMYDTAECNKVCWHYTQLVWATSHAVGCSVRYCRNIQNVVWGKYGGYMISCLYGPGGNIEGRRPYIRGDTPCSNCSSAFPYCVDGLCSRLNITTPATTTQPTRAPPPTSTRTPIQTTVAVGSASNLRPLIGGFTVAVYVIAYCVVLVT